MNIIRHLRHRLPSLFPRRMHVYCIGAAKTGTTSVAAMFKPEYLSAHEAEIETLNHKIIQYLENEIDSKDMESFILERDKRLKLEIESSHPMGYISDILANNFPEAKFVITIREPQSWLRSRLNFHHKVDPPAWREYREYFWLRPHKGHSEAEKPLAQYSLSSLDVYLNQYADHYRRVLDAVPHEQRLIIKTHELKNSTDTLAQFVGITGECLHTSHSNREPNKILPLENMDENYVKDKIWQHCEFIIRQYFPETLEDYSHANN